MGSKCFVLLLLLLFIYIYIQIINPMKKILLEFREGFGTFSNLLLNLEYVETNSFRKRSTLTNSNNVTGFNTYKGRGKMSSNVLVSLFITIVLGNVMKVFSTKNDGFVHLGRRNDSSEDSTTDGDGGRSEGTFLVDVSTADGFGRGLEAKTDIFIPAFDGFVFGVLEDPMLELVKTVVLISHGVCLQLYN